MRVKFIKDTDHYGKHATVDLPEAEAKSAIEAGHAVRAPAPLIVGGEEFRGVPVKRVKFVKGFTDAEKRLHPAGAAETLPVAVADAAIKAGAAEAFPFNVVGETAAEPLAAAQNKAVRPAAVARK